MKDQLVPYEHSLAILSECRAYCRLHLVENMTHSKFSFRRDFTWPLKNFLNDLDIVTWLFIIQNHWVLITDSSTGSSSITYVPNFFSLFFRMNVFLFLFSDSISCSFFSYSFYFIGWSGGGGLSALFWGLGSGGLAYTILVAGVGGVGVEFCPNSNESRSMELLDFLNSFSFSKERDLLLLFMSSWSYWFFIYILAYKSLSC